MMLTNRDVTRGVSYRAWEVTTMQPTCNHLRFSQMIVDPRASKLRAGGLWRGQYNLTYPQLLQPFELKVKGFMARLIQLDLSLTTDLPLPDDLPQPQQIDLQGLEPGGQLIEPHNTWHGNKCYPTNSKIYALDGIFSLILDLSRILPLIYALMRLPTIIVPDLIYTPSSTMRIKTFLAQMLVTLAYLAHIGIEAMLTNTSRPIYLIKPSILGRGDDKVHISTKTTCAFSSNTSIMYFFF